jgi:para-nitrobenzyl esterase
LASDDLFACPARNADRSVAKYVPTYAYEFNETGAPLAFQQPSFPLGASHVDDLPFVLDLSFLGLQPTFSPDDQALSNTTIQYWAQFARTGNPNFAGAPNWPAYTGKGGMIQSLIAPNPTTESDANFDSDHKCSSFWNELEGD